MYMTLVHPIENVAGCISLLIAGHLHSLDLHLQMPFPIYFLKQYYGFLETLTTIHLSM